MGINLRAVRFSEGRTSAGSTLQTPVENPARDREPWSRHNNRPSGRALAAEGPVPPQTPQFPKPRI